MHIIDNSADPDVLPFLFTIFANAPFKGCQA